MKTNEITPNPYKINWVFFIPGNGIVPLADQRRIDGTRHGIWHPRERSHQKWFVNKETATRYVKTLRGRLSKPYKVIMCTDKQFGMAQAPDYMPAFTEKQKAEAFII